MQTWTCEWKNHCLEVLEENVKTSLWSKTYCRVDQVSIGYEKLIPENFCTKLTHLSSFSLSLTMSTCCVIRSVAFPAVPIVTYKQKKMVKCAINKQVQKQRIISVQITRYCILIQVADQNQKNRPDNKEKHNFLPLQDSGGISLQDAPQQVASLHWTYRWFYKSFEYQVPDGPPKGLQIIANVHEPYLEPSKWIKRLTCSIFIPWFQLHSNHVKRELRQINKLTASSFSGFRLLEGIASRTPITCQ